MGDLIVLALIAVLIFWKGKASRARRELSDTVKEFKKGLHPEEINITPGRKEVKKG